MILFFPKVSEKRMTGWKACPTIKKYPFFRSLLVFLMRPETLTLPSLPYTQRERGHSSLLGDTIPTGLPASDYLSTVSRYGVEDRKTSVPNALCSAQV